MVCVVVRFVVAGCVMVGGCGDGDCCGDTLCMSRSVVVIASGCD